MNKLSVVYNDFFYATTRDKVCERVPAWKIWNMSSKVVSEQSATRHSYPALCFFSHLTLIFTTNVHTRDVLQKHSGNTEYAYEAPHNWFSINLY